MKDKDFSILKFMLQVMDTIQTRCKNETLDTFLADKWSLAAYAMNVQLLGENAKHLSEECQKSHPEVRWKEIFNLRNRISHDYAIVDFEILWSVILNDLPLLKSQIANMLDSN